jgi:FtsP/CotA-like multicopper oxidase with cupredoxin domain
MHKRYAWLIAIAFVAPASSSAAGVGVPAFSQGASRSPDLAVDEPARAVIHDNEQPAGRSLDGTLTVRLTAMDADWRPLGEQESGAVVYAFAADDGVPMIPSPFLRVERGTEVRLTLENTLDSTLVVQGLTERVESVPTMIVVPPGETREVAFTADAAGTYPF